MNRIHGLREIADDYDGSIFDVWGTLYDGGAAFNARWPSRGPRVGQTHRHSSNSPQRPGTVAARLDRIGIAADLYDGMYFRATTTSSRRGRGMSAWATVW